MASKPKSRWADSEADAAAEAQRKKERELKKRLKAERAQKVAAERQAAEAAATGSALQEGNSKKSLETEELPAAKRRCVSSEGDGDRRRMEAPTEASARTRNGETRSVQEGQWQKSSRSTGCLLRFESGGFRGSRSVEKYEKLNDIEEGAYGWVARGREKQTGRVVALKRLKMDPADKSGIPVTGLREIQVLRGCDHGNIVRLHEVVVGGDGGRNFEGVFLVLEFVEHDLKSILQDMPQSFLASEIKTLLRQLCSGVAYLHDRHILHRDLKTSNLLLNNRGRLKIADFGMARYAAPEGSPNAPKLTQLVVTLWYRAPELLLGAVEYGSAVDMWSVGCVFGELLMREPLLQGKNEVDELAKIFELCGLPSDTSWPGFRRLPHARTLRLPPSGNNKTKSSSLIRARFPLLTAAGASLLDDLLSLNPARRPSASDVLTHDYFTQNPRPKQEIMFPTFPSKAGQERRRRRQTPNAPQRGQQTGPMDLRTLDLSGIFSGRDKEERGAGFSLRMV